MNESCHRFNCGLNVQALNCVQMCVLCKCISTCERALTWEFCRHWLIECYVHVHAQTHIFTFHMQTFVYTYICKFIYICLCVVVRLDCTATYCDALQRTAAHCGTAALICGVQVWTAINVQALQVAASRCNTLQHTATFCNILQH